MNYKLSAAELAAELGSDTETGLTVERAHERIHSRGRNVIRVPKVKRTFAGVFRRLLSPLNVALLLMAALQLAAGGADRFLVAAALALCAAVGAAVWYIGLRRQGSEAAALKSAREQSVRVVRGGSEQTVLATLLTRGDVILLSQGQTVPADAKIISCRSLVVDESFIDGDGSSVTKSAVCGLEDESITVLYMGSKILAGSARAIVTEVGGETQLGRAVEALGRKEPSSALAARVSSIGSICAAAAAVMWAAALILRLAGGYGAASAFSNSCAAALTAAPVSLAAILLATSALDILGLKKRGVTVGSVSAMEAVGGSTVLCVGKRGALTELGFGVGELRPSKGFNENDLRLLAAMCTTAEINGGRASGDPMQAALIADALSNGFTAADIRENAPIERVLDNRGSAHVMTTVHKAEGGLRIICKGGADAVLSRCAYIYDNGARLLDPSRDIAAVIGEAQSMAAKELTVIGVAYKDAHDPGSDPESGLTFVGLVGLSNPLRKDSPQAVKVLNSMGVKVCVITDDNLTSASAVAEDCGIGASAVYRGAERIGSLRRLTRNTVLADTPPSMKADIVAEINSAGESVVTVGRSVGDVDAMSRSAASAATDASAGVCAAAADVNVSGAGLMRLAAAVRECKRIFVNNERIVGYLLSCNAAEMFCAVLALAMGYSIPFSPLALIWLNVVMASIGAVAVWREPYHRRDSVRAKRQGRDGGRVTAALLRGVIWRGALMGGAAMAFYAASAGSLSVEARRAAVFAALCAAFVLMAQSCRGDEPVVKRFGKNPAALVCLALGLGAGALALLAPPLASALGVGAAAPAPLSAAVGAGAISAVIAELFKAVREAAKPKKKKRA